METPEKLKELTVDELAQMNTRLKAKGLPLTSEVQLAWLDGARWGLKESLND
jgi:hypothetical protein